LHSVWRFLVILAVRETYPPPDDELVRQAAQDAASDPSAKKRADDLVKYAASREEGTLEYDWFNPVSNKAEHKRSYFKRIDVPKFRVDFIVLTGYFTPDQ